MRNKFELVQRMDIPELASKATLYRHIKTGAELLSVENSDTNKVFGASFRTPPADSSGLPHILEHCVLCGSRKYPAKDPFVQLLKGSLQTFLNAITYPDKTIYPVASQNLADFYNLVDVYLDAVFFPNITPQVLQQEGWHYEVNQQTGALDYKGVVFNEMKGNYSSPDYLIYEYSQNSLFPDNTYGFNSGGDPDVITDLDYPSFKAFHENLYHPSNSRIFFWGDDDPEKRLEICAEYLDQFSFRRVDSQVHPQEPFKEPIEVIKHYAADEGQDDHFVTINWVLPDVSEFERVMEFGVLEHLLIGTAAAPLRKALIDSGIGEDVTGAGFDSSLRQPCFSTGLKGVKSGDIDKVAPLVRDTLAAIVEDGFGNDHIEASMNTLEFRLRENNTGRTPRGLIVMMRTLKAWLHDHDPLQAMAYEHHLMQLKHKLAMGSDYFEYLIEEHLLNNNHCSVVKLVPDARLAEKRAQSERDKLEKIRKAMSPKELAKVAANGEQLKLMQNTPDSDEDLERIPKLSLADMEKQQEIVPATVDCKEDWELIHHDIFTNGILYLDAGFSLDEVEIDELPYISLLEDILIDVGTVDEDYSTLTRRIGRLTGGIETTTLVAGTRDDCSPASFLQLRGKCNADKAGEMLALFEDILIKVNLEDRERILQIALESKSSCEEDLLPAGHLVTNERLSSRLSCTGGIFDRASGTEYLLFLRRIIPEIRDDWQRVRERLKSLHSRLIKRQGMHCNATIDSASWQTIAPLIESFAEGMTSRQSTPRQCNLKPDPRHEFLTAETQVQYVGKAVRLREHGTEISGSELVVVRYLRTAWLWDQIRVQGGAYGAISSLGHFSGIFSMVSYRDPQVDRTLDVYNRTAEHLRKLDISAQELERAIIGAIGDLDKYRLPDAQGYVSLMDHLCGRSPADRQRLRDEVLATTTEDFRVFGEKIDHLAESGIVVALGSKKQLESSDFAKTASEVLSSPVL